MRHLLVIIFIALVPIAVDATDVDIAGTRISLPTPLGFALLTPSMQPMYDVSMDLRAQENKRLATFIDEAIVPQVLAGETPSFQRYINVEVLNSLAARNSSASDFMQFKGIMRDQLERAMAKLERQLPERMDRLSDRVTDTLDRELVFSISNVVPLPIHKETDTTLAMSSIVKYDRAGAVDNLVVTSTSTFVFLKGKIIFVYVYGGRDDLEWTRSQAAEWVASIIASNAYSPADHGVETQAHRKGIDWDRVIAKGVAGAVIGGLLGGVIGFFGWIGRRRKKKDDLTP
jgi:hypothetical protein